MIGFDPFFGAGYLGGLPFNPSAKLPVLISRIIPDAVPTEVFYSFYVFTCALIAPTAIVGMAFVLRWPYLHSALAALAGIFFWWIGALHWYHTAGMVSYVCACYLAIAYAAWVWSLCAVRDRKAAQVIAAGLLGGLGMWLHPTFGFMPAALFVAFLLLNREQFSFQMIGKAMVIAALAVMLNLPWILILATKGGDAILSQVQQPFQKAVGFDVLLEPLLGFWNPYMGSVLNPLSAIICLIAVISLDRIQRKNILPFVIAGCAILLYGAFGAGIDKLALLQPNRFIASGFLLLGLGAAFATGEFVLRLREGTYGLPGLIAGSIAVLVLLVPVRELVREISPDKNGHYGKIPPEITDTPESVAWLESWIKMNTSVDGRILFETSLGRIHGGGHVAGYLALKTKREFIGGAYPFCLPQVSFWDRFGFGGPIGDLSEERFASGLEIYNVGWIVAHSQGLVHLVERLKNVRPVADFGIIRIFSVDRKMSYIQSGKGRIQSRDFNQIIVSDVQGPTLTLRYSWIPGLVTSPPTRIEAEQVLPDFPPLIRIINPPDRFDLHLPR
ncbi:MAG: hypothetical protein NTX45_25870 [Proteobacteria bacterium]|nr:hypothetical protein [Pseudomonadota bacterium]